MINKVIEYGTTSMNPKDKSIRYGIIVITDHLERKDFEGLDANKVKMDAMDFIISHFKPKENEPT